MKNYIKGTNIFPRCLFMMLLCIAFTVSTVLAEERTLEQTLGWCEITANEAFDMALEAQAAIDYPLANRALSMAEEAGYHVAGVIRFARDSADPKLAWSGYRASNQVKAAIARVLLAAQDIASRASDPSVVHAANYLLENCELVQKENRAAMEMALMSIKRVSNRAETYSE